jgi:STE24 endopeptidase
MHPFTLCFLIAIAARLVLRIGLAARQIRHVTAHRAAVPPAFADRIPLAAHQRAADYTCVRSRFSMIGTVADAAILLALTLGGGLDLLDRAARDIATQPLLQGVVLVALVVAVTSVLELPFDLWRTFRIEQRFGFNRMTFALFFTDLAKSTLLGAAIGLPFVTLVLWLMGAMGSAWWFWVWLAWASFNLAMLVAYPLWIAPLFNTFTPLADESLRTRIETLLARCGFTVQGVFVMDGSKRSSHANAYFTGFGASRRIVFFDTLVKQLAPPEIEAVLAHELGHFRLRHIVKRMVLMLGLGLAGLWALSFLMQQPWFFGALGATQPSTAMALVLFFVALPAFLFPLEPLAALYSRRHEFEADQYAVRHASGADLSRALVKLYEDNAATLTPDPVHSAYYDSHPPASVRIARLQGA